LRAQDSKERPLRSILSDLENRYQISFTYVDEDVKNLFLTAPPDDYKINEAITYLHEKTHLDFQILNDRFITIRKPNIKLVSICGVLIEDETGSLINGATIQTGRKFTISDERGYFDLKDLNEKDTLLVRFLGYDYLRKPVQLISTDSCDTLRLRQQINKLKEIVITNFMTQGIDKDAEGKFIISSRSLELLPGLTEPDVLQTVQALPGILSIDETVSDINVRGGTNDQNLILWNGIRMYQSGHFFGLISAFNPFITQEIGLIKNGSSACLGEAVSSTLDIQTDNRVKRKMNGSVGANMINMDFNFTFPLFKKSSLQLSARRSIADLIKTPTYESYFDRVFRNTEVTKLSDNPDSLLNSGEEFRFYDVSLNYNYNVSSKDKFELSFLRIYNDFEYQENAFTSEDTVSKTSGLEQESIAAGMVYHRLWNEKLRTSTQLYLSNYQLGAVNFDILNDQRLIQENEVLEKGLKVDARFALSNRMDFFGGYQLSETGVGNLVDINNPVYRRYIKKVLLSHAFFTEANYSSGSGNTKLRGGLRINYLPKFDRWLVQPRLAVNQQFLNYYSIEILGEFKSQTTAQIIDLQNEFLGVEKRRWVLSNNEDIPVITSKQVSMGIHYQRSGMLISMEGYLKQVNGIISSSQGFQNQYQYIRSTGNYKVIGLDFLINKRIKNINGWISYSLARNDYYFAEFLTSYFPNNIDIRHSLSFGISYHVGKFQISGGINSRTGKPYTEPIGVTGDEIQYYPANTSRLENYLRFDLSAKYIIRFSNKVNGEFGASVWNIVNKQNMLNIYYQNDMRGDINEIQEYALSFTPNFMFRINFK
jgi:outer membrane cobalamin receptor